MDWTFLTSFTLRDAVIAMVAGAVVVFLVRLVRRRGEPPPSATAQPYKRDLKPLIKAAETLLRDDVRKRLPKAGLFSIGAVDLAPSNLAFWVTTTTDAEKLALSADATLNARLQQILREVGYPSGAIPRVGLAFESQETVDRDFAGDWWAAIK